LTFSILFSILYIVKEKKKGGNKMRAIDKVYEEQKGNVSWTNVVIGGQALAINPDDYNVKMETLRQQARADGFKTKKFNDEELLIYKGTLS